MKGRLPQLGFAVVIIGALLLNFGSGLPQLVGVAIFLGGLLRPVLEPVAERLRGLMNEYEGIEEASEAKVTTSTAATHFDAPPGYWEEYQRKVALRNRWLLTVPGQWWQANQDMRKQAVNALLRQLEELDVWFDEGEVGLVRYYPDPDQIARCLECDARSIDECKACELWPVIDG